MIYGLTIPVQRTRESDRIIAKMSVAADGSRYAAYFLVEAVAEKLLVSTQHQSIAKLMGRQYSGLTYDDF